ARAERREVELYKQCTGRTKLPTKPVRRVIMLAGRRAGKDRFESAVSVWRGALCADWRKYQSAGEGAVVILLGADKKQAAILRKYCAGLLEAPLLAAEVARSTGDVTEFKNGASLEIATRVRRTCMTCTHHFRSLTQSLIHNTRGLEFAKLPLR